MWTIVEIPAIERCYGTVRVGGGVHIYHVAYSYGTVVWTRGWRHVFPQQVISKPIYQLILYKDYDNRILPIFHGMWYRDQGNNFNMSKDYKSQILIELIGKYTETYNSAYGIVAYMVSKF